MFTAAQAARPDGEPRRSSSAASRSELGEVDLYLGFDCVLRRLAAEREQMAQPMSKLYRMKRVVGFNTYGEQYTSMHVNQTFTGVAIGRRRAAAP